MNRTAYIQLFLLLALWWGGSSQWSVVLAQAHRVNQDGSNTTLYDDGDSYILTPEHGTYVDGAGNRTTWGRDTTRFKSKKNIPIGQYQWVLEPRLGTIIDAENNDTVVHDFYKWNATDGYTGEYNYLANIGPPRFSCLYFNRNNTSDEFLFLQPKKCFLDHQKKQEQRNAFQVVK